jgi:hypothetical protein
MIYYYFFLMCVLKLKLIKGLCFNSFQVFFFLFSFFLYTSFRFKLHIWEFVNMF